MIKRDKTTVVLIIAIISFIGSIVLYGYIYVSFQNKKESVSSLRGRVAADQIKIDELQKAERNLKTTLGIGDRLSMLYIKQEAIVDFIQILETLMKANSLSGSVESVVEINDPTLEPLNKEYLALKLSATGSFNGVAKFASLIEKLPYKATVDSVAFTSTVGDKNQSPSIKDKKSLGAWRVSIDLKTIVVKSNMQHMGMGAENSNTTKNNE